MLLLSTFFSWGKFSAGPLSLNVSGWDTGALGKLVFFAALIAILLVVVDYMNVDVSQMPVPVSLALAVTAGAGAAVRDPALPLHARRPEPGLGPVSRHHRRGRPGLRRLAEAAGRRE